jgi:hypothetical protein
MRASDQHQDPGLEKGAANARRVDPRAYWAYLREHEDRQQVQNKSAERGLLWLCVEPRPPPSREGRSLLPVIWYSSTTIEVESNNAPSSRTGGARSCRTGPSGRYSLIGTLRTLYAPSLSGAPCGSADGGRVCIDGCAAGGEPGRAGKVVGVIFDATRQ